MKQRTAKKVAAVLGGLVLVTAGVAGGFVLDQPQTIVQHEVQVKEVPTPYVVEKIVEVEVPVEVPYEVAVEDDEFLKMVCDRMMYEDLFECKQEVESEDAALKLALELIGDERDLFDMLEDEGLVEDEDEVRVVKVYDDFEDVNVVESDYDDGEYRFEIRVKVDDEDRDKKFVVIADVEVEDGEAKLRNVYSLDK